MRVIKIQPATYTNTLLKKYRDLSYIVKSVPFILTDYDPEQYICLCSKQHNWKKA